MIHFHVHVFGHICCVSLVMASQLFGHICCCFVLASHLLGDICCVCFVFWASFLAHVLCARRGDTQNAILFVAIIFGHVGDVC